MTQRFSDPWPRGYGVLLILIATALAGAARWGWHVAGTWRVAAVILVLVFGVTGIKYLFFGNRAAMDDRAFVQTFDPEKISWRQATRFLAIGLGLAGVSILICRWLLPD